MSNSITGSNLSRRRVLTSLAGGLGAAAIGSAGAAMAQVHSKEQPGEESKNAAGSAPRQRVSVRFDRQLGPMNIDRFSLGQGGFASQPMFPNLTAEVRMLRPRVIRLFVQEYYDLLPAPGKYHFDTLDAAVDLILQAGATPLMCMVFKPKVLFPRIDQDLVTPSSWEAWDTLVYDVVRHYKNRSGGGWYWEIGNEWDAESGGGTPYHMTPDQYTKFYRHTALAVRKADSEARVGGPAQARFDAGLIPALVASCAAEGTPLDFVSWHGYQNDPKWFGNTTRSVRKLLSQYPSLHVETVIDEWNIALGEGYVDPRLQPAFVAETTYQMVEAGLDLSCYYHIRDYPFAKEQFVKFYPASMVAEQEIFWDRRPVYLGLFDYEGQARPAYFLFRLLERLTGERIAVDSDSSTVHALATMDDKLKISSILLWNYSGEPVEVDLSLMRLPRKASIWRYVLDATGASSDYNARLRPEAVIKVEEGDGQVPLRLDPWGITQLSLELH